MGQTAHPGRRRGAGCALLAAAVVAGVPVLSGCSTSLAAAGTSLEGAVGATVLHPDGSTIPGIDGLRLRPGDHVRIVAGGRAALVTRSCVAFVGAGLAVRVVGGMPDMLVARA